LNDEIEIKADIFAFNFLMTKHVLYYFIERENIIEWTIENVIKYEQYFQIDHNSLIKLLYNEKVINESQLADLISWSAYQSIENNNDEYINIVKNKIMKNVYED